ncbi:ABC transporter ATP-binding protein [Nocardioides sp. R-C-SC26]|uniref:ABC transporter ATP-binding protein n=1 Tax=Nocardioides sp. R-C-SC26 TaxID=2870414 RepID=UPI001E54C468|nr:ABC transporter ATP-binding protein [Nocardioides sp. R-C-SC26]
MLELDAVSVHYDGVPALSDADVRIEDGEVVAVLGPSGCGKSTLLRAVAGLEPLSAGRITWDGADLAGVPTHRRGFALMFQDGQLFAHLSVAANVGYALRLRRVPDRARRVADLLDLVGLAGYADRLPGTLSGGERQRVALARSMAAAPRALLLDEPLSALDAALRERLASDLRRILTESGTTTLLVTHDQEEAFALADRLVVLRGGRVVQQGSAREVWARPVDAETALFLGYARVLDGEPARRVLAALPQRQASPGTAGQVALRRSALVADATTVDAPGAAGLVGAVVSARATPDAVRLVVDVEGVGVLDAVSAAGVPAPGDRVRLRLDAARVALL